MTMIAYKDGVMAADTGTMAGDIYLADARDKVIKLANGTLVGCAGKVTVCRSFKTWATMGFPTGAEPIAEPEEGDFGAIVVSPGGEVWQYDHQMRGSPVSVPFIVQGCAEEFLLGALAAGASARQAVALGIKYGLGFGKVVSVKLGGPAVALSAEEGAEAGEPEPGSAEFYGLRRPEAPGEQA